MDYYKILLPLALILILSKLLGLGLKKIGLPQVVAMLLAGVIIGLVQYIPNQSLITADVKDGLGFIAKIGVILIMFSAGMDTDIKVIKSTGAEAVVITILGVVVPLGMGTLLAWLFFPSSGIYSQLFYGVIITATSVSITVATLKEMGKLNSPIGTAIVSAAIIDDVIGVVLISLVSGLAGQGSGSEDLLGSALAPYFHGGMEALAVIIKIVVYIVFIVGAGLLIRFFFKKLEDHFPEHRRVAVLSFGVCFLFAYLSEAVFGIADITGAFFAGLLLSGMRDTNYVDYKVESCCYLVFSPVFFANIGINSDFSGITATMIGFGVCYIIVALLGKFIGCGLGAMMFKCGIKDSLRAGIGMMARAEVVLVCTQKGVDYGMVDKGIYPFILILIIISSFIVPMLLKLTYKKEKALTLSPDGAAILASATDISDNSEQTLNQEPTDTTNE